MMESPDREQRLNYVLRIRSVKKPEIAEREVPVFFYTLYVQDVEHQVQGNWFLSDLRFWQFQDPLEAI